MLQLRANPGPTGRQLREMLEAKGLIGRPVTGVVNYGYFGDAGGLPILNAKAGTLNKYEELVKMDNGGVITIPFSLNAGDLDTPIMGRRLHHTQGTDILVYNVRPLRGQVRSDYYTQIVPKAAEYRVWVYRDKALATYIKELQYAARNGRHGRSTEVWNWQNGYAFHFVDSTRAPVRARTLAISAVQALGLDFGAVDLLRGRDGHYYVLEVNTAPGTQGEPRQGLVNLVTNIQQWVNNGFPRR